MSETDVRTAVTWLARERGADADALLAGEARDALYALLISRPADPLPDAIDAALHRVYAEESAARSAVVAGDLPRLGEGALANISLWQGDITTLAIDVIVNAANDRLLGCFIPGHRCIDNVIHAVAGPWLRGDCGVLMEQQGHPEPTGGAKLTDGHYLPAATVAHTVGPIVPSHRPTDDDARLLASCYTSCLNAAAASGAESIAFCCISTGVFGYPIELAAPVAIDAVTQWLAAHAATPMHVVFNTFSDHDTEIYRHLLEPAA